MNLESRQGTVLTIIGVFVGAILGVLTYSFSAFWPYFLLTFIIAILVLYAYYLNLEITKLKRIAAPGQDKTSSNKTVQLEQTLEELQKKNQDLVDENELLKEQNKNLKAEIDHRDTTWIPMKEIELILDQKQVVSIPDLKSGDRVRIIIEGSKRFTSFLTKAPSYNRRDAILDCPEAKRWRDEVTISKDGNYNLVIDSY
jgi:hypothetical protein